MKWLKIHTLYLCKHCIRFSAIFHTKSTILWFQLYKEKIKRIRGKKGKIERHAGLPQDGTEHG